MESCVGAMEDALAALARDELSMPLRFVVRPPGEQLLGLMPAHRAGPEPLFSLKEIVIAPANGAAGSTRIRAPCSSTTATTGVLRAVLNASAITEIRTAAVSAVATKLLARPARAAWRSSARGCRRARTRTRCERWSDDPELRIWSRTPAHAEALALESHAVVCETIEEALDGADVVCTCTAVARADRPPRVARPGTHVNAVGSSVPFARELESDVVAEAALFVDRRESTLNESGDYLRAVEEAGIGARPHPRRARRAARRHRIRAGTAATS